MKPNRQQLRIIKATEPKILCMAAAGSSKTYVLTERLRRLVKEGYDRRKIYAITFTNLAAEEMRQRLGKDGEDVTICTLHSLANSICLENGISTKSLLDADEFDKVIEKALIIAEKDYPKIEHLLVDEFQDVSDLDYTFISKLNAENLFLVGDYRQAIYSFRGANSKIIEGLYYDNEFTKYNLNTCFRCPSRVLKFANELLDSVETIGEKPKVYKEEDGTVEDSLTFDQALEDIQLDGDYQNWFILCRTNKEVRKAERILEDKKIPATTFRKAELGLEELNAILKYRNVKILTGHMAKGLSNKKIIAIGAKTFNEEEQKIAYVMATRAEEKLYWVPSICNGIKDEFDDDNPEEYKNKKKRNRLGNAFETARSAIISFE